MRGRTAAQACRLLLPPPSDAGGGRAEPPEDWVAYSEFGRRNVVLIRSEAVLRAAGIALDPAVAEVAARERSRIERAVRVIAGLGALCERHGMLYVFPKAFQHYPDMGHDVDLLVGERSGRIDALIRQEYPCLPGAMSLTNRVAGKTSWEIRGETTPLEIHHGRLGHVGEHGDYAERVLARRARIDIAGITTWVPSSEDQLIIQVLQRLYSHLSLRLSDVIHSTHLLGRNLDWDYILETVERMGMATGLCCYLRYVDQVSPGVLPRPAIERAQGGWGVVRSGASGWRPPLLAVAWLCGRSCADHLVLGNWETLGRLLLLAPLSGMAIGRAVLRRMERTVRRSPTREVGKDAQAPV